MFATSQMQEPAFSDAMDAIRQDDDDDDFYEDLPPKQIWTTMSSNSSQVSPLPEQNRTTPIKARHVIMGSMIPALCTPDSTTQTTNETMEVPTITLGIAAAPFYKREEDENDHSQSGISSMEASEGATDNNTSAGSSIPSFNTQRRILDLQDELARTKAELEQVRLQQPTSQGSDQDEFVPEKLNFEEVGETEESSVQAVIVEDYDALRDRLCNSERRVLLLQEKLRESHSIARRLHGTLQRVQKRMQHYVLADLQCAAEDVAFMDLCANILILGLVLLAPAILLYWNDIGMFALVIGVTFSAVEIAIRL